MKFRVFIFYAAAFLVIASIVSLAIIYSGSVAKRNESGPLGESFVAARVDGAEITGGDINRELASIGNLPPEGSAELKKQQQEVLELLVQLQLLKNEAKNRGITVTEAALQARLDQYMSQGRETFEAFLVENNMTEEQFLNRLRENMLIEQLGSEVRTELVENIEISDEDVEAYYQEHIENFDISEVAHIYIRIAPPGEEEQIEAAREKAEEAIGRLKNGMSFARVVRQYSDDASTKNSGGVLGPLNSGLLSKTFVNAARKLEAGAFTTEPLQVQDGFHVIKRIDEQYQPLEDVKVDISQELTQKRVEQAFEKWIEEVRARADVQIYL